MTQDPEPITEEARLEPEYVDVVEETKQPEPEPEAQPEPEKDDGLIPGAPWIMIAGPKGAGKSRLAATMENAYCLDTEPPGSATAYPKNHRKAFEFGETMYKDLVATVDSMIAKTKKVGRNLETTAGLQISSVSIDTFDTLQKVLLDRYLSSKERPGWHLRKFGADAIWAPAMEMRDWGLILNYQMPLVTKLKMLKIPVVWVCHSKLIPPQYENNGDVKQRGYRGLDVAGSIENFILNLCDYVLHISVEQDGARTVYTQPTVVEDIEILAADRHNLFKNTEHDWTRFSLPVENGKPKRQVVKFICDNHSY